jgi:hypothetical protein
LNVIANVQRGETALSALTYIYNRAEQETGEPLRLIDGDCHGTPMWPNDKAALAAAVQVTDARKDARSQLDRPIMLCTIRSSPDLPPPTDEEWAEFSRRVLGVANLLSEGSRRGCRWVALGVAERQVHVLASLVHDDSRPARSLYNLPMAVFRECQSIGAEYGRRFPDAPVTVRPAAQGPAPQVTVSISGKPTGSVVAEGAVDELSAALLRHAGFQQIQDWYGRRHRLPSDTPAGDRTAIATRAAKMLTAARYTVRLDPALAAPDPAPSGRLSLDDQLLDLTDRIRAARTGSELRACVEQLVDPDQGVLGRVREALEAAGEQVTDLDEEAYRLGDRFAVASEFVTAAEGELTGAIQEVARIGGPGHTPDHGVTRKAALAASPAAAGSPAPAAVGPEVPPNTQPAAPPSPSSPAPSRHAR